MALNRDLHNLDLGFFYLSYNPNIFEMHLRYHIYLFNIYFNIYV